MRRSVVGLVFVLAATGCTRTSPSIEVDGKRVFLMQGQSPSGGCDDQASCDMYSTVKIDGFRYRYTRVGPRDRAVAKPDRSGQLFALPDEDQDHCWAEARTIDGIDPHEFISVFGSDPCDSEERWFFAMNVGR